jgi:hypothetical protein
MNLRSYIPETTNECSFFTDTLDMLKKSRRKSRVKQDSNNMSSSHEPTLDEEALNNLDEETLEEGTIEEVTLKEASEEATMTNSVDPTLNETMIDYDTTYSENLQDGSEVCTNNHLGDECVATNTFSQSNLEISSNKERNVITNKDKIEDITCYFDDETDLCNIETKHLSNVLIQSFPIINSSFAKSGYKGVHKIKIGWLVQININRDNLTKDNQMRFCGIYTELAMATFVFSMVSQKLFLASSIDFLYKTLNNLKILSSGSDNSFLYT